MNQDSNGQEPKNDISGAYKRKEYGWFAVYLIIVVIAARLAGAIGAGVSVLVVAGLYKTLKNQTYSVSKKILLSLAYVVGGICLTLVAIYIFLGGFSLIFGDKAVDSLNPEYQAAQQRTVSNEPFESSTTPESSTVTNTTADENTSNTSSVSTNTSFDGSNYNDSKYGFSIKYPKGWIVDTSGTNANVEFDIPTADEVALITVSAESAKGYDLQTYSKNVIRGFFSSEGGNNANLKIVAEGNSTLAGSPAYKFEVTSDFINGSDVYPFHGVYVVSVHAGIGYVIFATSFESLWSKRIETYNSVIDSFKFPG